jgi:signal transduction histidine kinase
LVDLAQQVSIAVHATRLTRDLQMSRERLVTAREEERRRLRRDLHDGLGPSLAGLSMQLDTARALLPDNPEAGMELLAETQDEIKEAIGNVRRLVYALRPPALDQFGLVAAIREHAMREGHRHGLAIVLDAPDALPPLSAAVEVAAYYIAVEAITNVVRHARATRCSVRLWIDNALYLTVVDNGVGVQDTYRAGIGLHSMQERAAELGGRCAIMPGEDGGTLVRAVLPLRR